MKKCCENCVSLGTHEVRAAAEGVVGYIHASWCAQSCCYITRQGMLRVYCDDYEQKKDKFELCAEEIWDLENCTRPVRGQFVVLASKILKRHFGEQG